MTPPARIRYTDPKMKQLFLIAIAAAALSTSAVAQKNPFLGRWDLTVTTATDSYPDWMELSESGGKLDALIQPRSGGARHASEARLDGARLIVTPGGGRGPAMVWELDAQGDKLTGTIKRGDTSAARIAGVRAPALNRPMPAAWTNPEPIFNGKDLTGWEPIGNAPQPLGRERRRPAQRDQWRQPPHHAQVRRFQAPHRIQLSRRGQ